MHRWAVDQEQRIGGLAEQAIVLYVRRQAMLDQLVRVLQPLQLVVLMCCEGYQTVIQLLLLLSMVPL